MGEHCLLSHYSGGSRLFGFSHCLLQPKSPSDLYAFACRASKAWLIMAGLVIFQSHLFSTFQHRSQSTFALVSLEFFPGFLN